MAGCSDKREREGAVNEATCGRDSRDGRLFAPLWPERLVSPRSGEGGCLTLVVLILLPA